MLCQRHGRSELAAQLVVRNVGRRISAQLVRAKSTAHFISKLGDVEEEADETLFWLELLETSGLVPAKRLTALKQEADELVAIVVASIKTARRRRDK